MIANKLISRQNIFLTIAFSALFLSYTLNITYLFVIILAAIACILVSILSRNLLNNDRNNNTALVITTLISILAPLSWFVIFKEHAVVHMILDYIVWYIPFLLYAFAAIGQAIHLLFCKKNKIY